MKTETTDMGRTDQDIYEDVIKANQKRMLKNMNTQSTSDTPETDALYKNDHRPNLMEHARKLERERDQWVAKAAELSAERESNAMQALAYEAERDEARAQLREERQLHSQTLDERDEARNLFESSKRARASLNEACDHLQRERDRLQKLAEANGKLAHSSACEAMDYRRERDEARASLAAAEAWSATLADIGDDFRAANAELRAAIRNLRDVQGRHHTQIATERLFALLPESSSQPERG